MIAGKTYVQLLNSPAANQLPGEAVQQLPVRVQFPAGFLSTP